MRTLLGVCAVALRLIRPSRGLHRAPRGEWIEWPARPRPSDHRPPTVRAAASRVRPYATRVLPATAAPHGPDLPWSPPVPAEDNLPLPAMVRPYLIAHEQREQERARAARVRRPGADLLLAEAS